MGIIKLKVIYYEYVDTMSLIHRVFFTMSPILYIGRVPANARLLNRRKLFCIKDKRLVMLTVDQA